MSIDPLVELKFSEEFKNKLHNLSKKYRNIRADLQPILDDLQAGIFEGDQISNVGYTVFKREGWDDPAMDIYNDLDPLTGMNIQRGDIV